MYVMLKSYDFKNELFFMEQKHKKKIYILLFYKIYPLKFKKNTFKRK